MCREIVALLEGCKTQNLLLCLTVPCKWLLPLATGTNQDCENNMEEMLFSLSQLVLVATYMAWLGAIKDFGSCTLLATAGKCSGQKGQRGRKKN